MRPPKPVAIIDVGSNSVRLVVYSGSRRVPTPIFNEKVLAGLGRCVGDTGMISEEGWARAIDVLKRFKILLRHMAIRRPHVIATAAARDAGNGPEFVAAIEGLGFDCRVISTEEEAWLAGEGVLSAIPDANGIVADLGGGSVELVEVADGMAGLGFSLPLGVLRLRCGQAGERQAAQILLAAIGKSSLAERASGRPLYLVGGSWRALAKIDMIATDFPLPAAHAYTFAPDRIPVLRRLVADPDPSWGKRIPAARLSTTPVAAMLLEHLSGLLRPSRLVISSFGIREGLLYSKLGQSERRLDPLIAAARDTAASDHRFGEHGQILDDWLSPLFDDPPAARRIRLAACLLADVAWPASPDFRADRATEMALHGNWIAITAAERIMLAQALSSSFGRDRLPDHRLASLCADDAIRRARQWGQAMRLGQRLSAGVGSILQRCRFETADGSVRLVLPRSEAALLTDPVAKRVERLAVALGRDIELALE